MFTLEVRENPLLRFSQQASPAWCALDNKEGKHYRRGCATSRRRKRCTVQYGWRIVGIPTEASPGQGCAEAVMAFGMLAAGQANADPRLVEPIPT